MVIDKNTQHFIDEGVSAFIDHDYHTSINCFTRSIANSSGYGPAYISRGAAYMKIGDIEASIQDFEKSTSLNPGHARAHHMFGLALEMKGNLLEALEEEGEISFFHDSFD